MALEGTGIGKDLVEIAMAILSIALIALLIGHAGSTTSILNSGVGGFNKLLQTVTLQNGYGTSNSYNNYSTSGQ